MNPANGVIKVGFLADLREIRGKCATELTVACTNRMATKTTTRFEELLPVGRVTLLLLWNFAFEAILPEIRGNRFDLLVTVAVEAETPERRHLRTRSERLRILQPDCNPFLA